MTSLSVGYGPNRGKQCTGLPTTTCFGVLTFLSFALKTCGERFIIILVRSLKEDKQTVFFPTKGTLTGSSVLVPDTEVVFVLWVLLLLTVC